MRRSSVVLLCTLVLLLTGCTDEEPGTPQSTSEPTTEATAEPTTTSEATDDPTTAAAEIIYYDPPATVETEDDLDQLDGAPQDFVDFVASQLDPDAGECAPIVWVYSLDPTGYAYGGIGGCGGAQLVWKRTGESWEQVAGTQDTWSCDDLTAAAVPVELLAGPQGEDVLCLTDDSSVETYAG